MKFDPQGASYEQFHAMLGTLRDTDPVYYWEEHDCWVVTRYEDLTTVLNDPRFTVQGAMSAMNAGYCPQAKAIIAQGINWEAIPQLGSSEGAPLARLRSVVQTMVAPARLREIEPKIRAIATELIAGFAGKGECELVSEFCFRLPILTIFSLIGLRPEDHDLMQLQAWCDGMFKLWLGPLPDHEQVIAAEHAIRFQEYLRTVIADRRGQPRTDVLDELITEIDSGSGRINEDELIVMLAINIIAAGHESSKSAIANGMFQLLRERDRWEALKADPASIPAVVEEVLRIDGSVPAWYRVAAEPVELGGKTLPAGANIIMMMASGNHDAARFADPESFCPARGVRNGHLTFTAGRHFCPGAPLARLEMQIALQELSRQLPDMRLREGQTIAYQPAVVMRNLKSLYIEWRDA